MKRNSIFIFILAALPAIQPTAPALGAVSVTTSQQSAAIALLLQSSCTKLHDLMKVTSPEATDSGR